NTATPSATPSPIAWLFGETAGNLRTTKDFGVVGGVAVTDNSDTPQLIVSEDNRMLYWNYPSTYLGMPNLYNGKAADGEFGDITNQGYSSLKATQHYLYVSRQSCNNCSLRARIDIYSLPVNANSVPIASLRYPEDFATVDGVQ